MARGTAEKSAGRKGMVFLPGGTFAMGSERHYPEEAPVREVTVDGFWLDEHPVTNLEFTRFVKATGHVTAAERAPDPADYPDAKPDMLFAGSVVFQKSAGPGGPEQPLQLVDVDARRRLATSGRSGELAARP